MSDVVSALFREMQVVVSAAVAANGQGGLFTDAAERFAEPCDQQTVEASRLPVVDEWLDQAVAAAPAPWKSLADRLHEATPEIQWIRSYENLESSAELDAFRDHYSYQLLAGPLFRGHQPPLLIDGVLVGFTLQAPNILYPEHHHKPAEMYGVISGTLEWFVGDHWSTVTPGDVIVHRSHESHAMRTGDEPALTWVIWSDSPHSHVYMPSMDPADQTMAPRSYR